MRILYVSQYFPPEMGAPAARVHELAREWARAGHQVTVLTGFPNHPTGRVPECYLPLLRRGSHRERIDGIDVVRTWLYTAPNRRPRERILTYTSFCASAALRGVWLPRPDVVIGTSPQLLIALARWGLARRFGRPFVFEVRDLWPESLAASDVCLVLLRRSDVFETVLPSKMLEFMACARPVIVGVGGLARSLVEESGGGVCVTPEDHTELAQAVCRLYAQPHLGVQLGERGRCYVLQRFTRKAKAGAYLAVLHDLVCR